MKSVTSSVKRHPAMNLFRKTLKKQIPISVLFTVFGLLLSVGAPLREWLWINTNLNGEEKLSLGYNFQFSTVAGFSAAVGLVFILLLFNFNFLFSKKAGDVFQALPLTRNGLLFSRSLPALVGGIFALAVSFGGFSVINVLPQVESINFSLIALSFLLALLFLVLLWSAMLLIVVCSGGILDVIIALATFNLAPIALIWLLITSAESTTIGIYLPETLLIYTSPFVFTFFKLGCFTEPNYGEEQFMVDRVEYTTIWTVLGTIALTLALTGVVIKLFGIRKTETAGSAYSFKFVPILLSILASMVGGYFLGFLFAGDVDLLEITFWIFFSIGAMLCSVAIGMIISRGFKKIKRSLVNGAISIALLIVVALTTNLIVLNAERHVPKAEKVESVSILYSDVVYTEPEDIKTMIKLHENIVSNLHTDILENTTPDIFNNFRGFDIVYTLENGRQIRRNYGLYLINSAELSDELFSLMQNEAFLGQYDYMTAASYKVSFDVMFQSQPANEDYYTATLTPEETKIFLQLFRNDMMAASITVINDPCVQVVAQSENFYKDLWIPASFTKTLDYLADHKVPTEEERFEK